jgi:hypothetical protein
LPEYRVYFLDAQNHITSRLEINAPDDAAVLEDIRLQHPAAPYEIWELARLVRSKDASGLGPDTDDSPRALRRSAEIRPFPGL